ncbi:GNAT family N-acetyltransferase [Aeromicrobium panaciterrae]|uniref:GNAT family N-acetyltransferase n=1 Tax=Aeromicrobium panaciterrae TaxID=363861 RepID=UPI0031D721E0
MIVRPVVAADLDAWRPLWDGYNAFYELGGDTVPPDEVTAVTWQRFLDPAEPMFALVAEDDGRLIGLVHYLFHRSTTSIEPVCYLRDLFTLPSERGKGVGRALIQAVGDAARTEGVTNVYWQTHETNTAGRRLYDTVATNEGFIVYTLN